MLCRGEVQRYDPFGLDCPVLAGSNEASNFMGSSLYKVFTFTGYLLFFPKGPLGFASLGGFHLTCFLVLTF